MPTRRGTLSRPSCVGRDPREGQHCEGEPPGAGGEESAPELSVILYRAGTKGKSQIGHPHIFISSLPLSLPTPSPHIHVGAPIGDL
eukprot:613783-Prymnesium_polylepis.1